jgi:methylglyoxal synthase
MEIAIIADDTKKELMTQFCIAYCGILGRHSLTATQTTGKYIKEATGLDIDCMLPGDIGGMDQIVARVAYNEIDMVLYFRDGVKNEPEYEAEHNLLRECDANNIPIATNIATAEVLVLALERGNLDWREIVNPRSEYNRRRRGQIV